MARAKPTTPARESYIAVLAKRIAQVMPPRKGADVTDLQCEEIMALEMSASFAKPHTVSDAAVLTAIAIGMMNLLDHTDERDSEHDCALRAMDGVLGFLVANGGKVNERFAEYIGAELGYVVSSADRKLGPADGRFAAGVGADASDLDRTIPAGCRPLGPAKDWPVAGPGGES